MKNTVPIYFAVAALAGTAAGQDWVQTSGPAGSFISALDASGGEAVAGSFPGRVYLSTDSGSSWHDATSNLPHSPVQAILKLDGNIYIGQRDVGLWRSSNHGVQWMDVSPDPAVPDVQSLATQDGLVFALVQGSSNSELFSSGNAGQSWDPVSMPEPFFKVFGIDGALYAGGFFGFYRSTDHGQHWHIGGAGLQFGIVEGLVKNGATLIAESGNKLFRSTDDGDHWVPADGALPSSYIAQTLATDGAAIFAGMQGIPGPAFSVYRSDDNGMSWNAAATGLPPGLDRFMQSMDGRSGLVLAGTISGLFRTADGVNWTDATAGIIGSTVTQLSASGADLFGVIGNSGRVFRTSNLGGAWTGSGDGIAPGAAAISVYAAGSQTVFAGTMYDGLFRSMDNGQTFAAVNSGIPQYNGTAGLQYREISAVIRHSGSFFAGTGSGTEFFNGGFQTSGGGMLRSTDGATWQRINSGFPIIARNSFNQPVYDPVVTLFDGGSFLLATTVFSGVQRTTNAGTQWSAANAGLPTNAFQQFPVITGVAGLGGAVYAACDGFAFGGSGGTGIFKSTDGGLSWSRSDAGIPGEHPVNAVIAVDQTLYASVGNTFGPLPGDGVYASTDHGQGWALVGAALSGLGADALASVNGTVFACVRGTGVWKLVDACYANCDGSTAAPILNINDFICFQGRFAAGDTYANCDGSTQPPILNINDFLCFQSRFATGCR